jgi:hypothetical protein
MNTGTIPQCERPALLGEQNRVRAMPARAGRPSVCVVCCATPGSPVGTLVTLASAFANDAPATAIILSEEVEEVSADGVQTIRVPCGTKLSKLRRLRDLVSTDLICICDPDLAVRTDACRAVLRRALDESAGGRDVVAFGIVESREDGTLLSGVIALDKWLSHRLLRRSLWAMGAGVTLPGQFLIVSRSLLDRLSPDVDSYLDDLYLGWLARQVRATVCRLPVVVGAEDPRRYWGSLLAQRMRWMKGLAALFRHLQPRPSAVGLLTVHYLAYHGIPIVTGVALALLALSNPLAALGVFVGLAALLAKCAKQPLRISCCFLVVFPMLHLLATLLWWVPVRRSVLTRR